MLAVVSLEGYCQRVLTASLPQPFSTPEVPPPTVKRAETFTAVISLPPTDAPIIDTYPPLLISSWFCSCALSQVECRLCIRRLRRALRRGSAQVPPCLLPCIHGRNNGGTTENPSIDVFSLMQEGDTSCIVLDVGRHLTNSRSSLCTNTQNCRRVAWQGVHKNQVRCVSLPHDKDAWSIVFSHVRQGFRMKHMVHTGWIFQSATFRFVVSGPRRPTLNTSLRVLFLCARLWTIVAFVLIPQESSPTLQMASVYGVQQTAKHAPAFILPRVAEVCM